MTEEEKEKINTINKTADIFIGNKVKASTISKFLTKDNRKEIVKSLEEVILREVDERAKIPAFGFKNWRNYHNGFYVAPSIKLFPDNLNLSGGYEYDLGKMKDLTKSGVFGTIQNAISGGAQFKALWEKGKLDDEMKTGLQYQDRINIWKNVPFFQNIDTSSLSSISFTFNWGQAGLYNCELEVVRPIMCLFHCFNFETDENGFIETELFSPKFNVVTNAYETLFNDLKSVSSEDILAKMTNRNSTTGKTGADVKTISDLTASLSKIYKNVASSTEVTPVMIRVGTGIIGPVYVSEVNYEFDYSQQDQYGMPYKGKITLNGIKPILIESIKNQMMIGGNGIQE